MVASLAVGDHPCHHPAMEQRLSLVTLGVADLVRARAFYEALGWRAHPVSREGVVVFFQANGLVLSLFGRGALAEDAGVDEPSSRFAPMALAYNGRSEAEVDAAFEAAVGAGAAALKPPCPAAWGGYSGYFADPDGHLWELAYNPGFALDGAGNVRLPGHASSEAAREGSLDDLLTAARVAQGRAYAPYSGFAVGAAIRGAGGAVFAGCNVENAAYPAGTCAEEAAIAAMVAAGERRIAEVLILGEGEALVTPCGACRQRLREFAGPETPVHVAGPEGVRRRFTVGELLPAAFGPANLSGGPEPGRPAP